MALTKKQKQLIEELDTLFGLLSLNYANIEELDSSARLPTLRLIKNQIIRSEIIMTYCLIDELLSDPICRHFFGKKKSFIYLWKTKRFQNFNYYILEELSLLKKLRLVKQFEKIPRKVEKDIQKINSLRNGIAHYFFPENIKEYRSHKKVLYKGKDIFTVEGIRRFLEDREKIYSFLFKKFFTLDY